MVKVLAVLAEDWGFNSQHSHCGYQPPVIPDPEDPKTSGLQTLDVHGSQTCIK